MSTIFIWMYLYVTLLYCDVVMYSHDHYDLGTWVIILFILVNCNEYQLTNGLLAIHVHHMQLSCSNLSSSLILYRHSLHRYDQPHSCMHDVKALGFNVNCCVFFSLLFLRHLFKRQLIRWGDGMSPNNVSPYECSWTPGPRINRPLWHNFPGLIYPCHFALYKTFRLVQNDRDVSIQGHCVSGTIHLGDQGSQNIHRVHIILGLSSPHHW